jgi:uncharacterized membrane protein YtjA (UPF0391 family)
LVYFTTARRNPKFEIPVSWIFGFQFLRIFLLAFDVHEFGRRQSKLTVTVAEEGGHDMLRMAIVFLIIALIAGALGLFRVEAVSSQVAWILFVIFLILFLVSLVFGGVRRPPPV